jgi:hypothetical protein
MTRAEPAARSDDEARPDERPHEAGSPEIRLVHVSDLHVGRKFNRDLWNSFSARCRKLGPRAILVTGDLVDTPWRWRLAEARALLYALQRDTQESVRDGGKCELVVVPGNHDTRITGLLPTGSWWVRVAVGLCALAVLGVVAWLVPPARTALAWAAVPLLLALEVLYRYLLPDFRSVFGDAAPRGCRRVKLADIPVEIFPFDSSTRQRAWARGEIPIGQFMDLAHRPDDEAAKGGPAPYRIALVHHHPLPIPYDEWAEQTLILRNAGAFLRVIMRAGVRLVLHGHKHRWSFARITVDAEGAEPREVGVLAGQSVTSGTAHDGTVRWGFNLLTVDPDGGVQVTQYTSEGGPFEPRHRFYVEDAPSTTRALSRDARERHGVSAGAVRVMTTVSEDGDAHMRIEIAGFRVVEERRVWGAMPGTLQFDCNHGHIELLEVGPLDGHGPRGIRVKKQGNTLREQSGILEFGRNVTSRDEPFDFFMQVHLLNSFAMSVPQFRCMYEADDEPALEFAFGRTFDFPCNVFQMSVQLPLGFEIDGWPELEVQDDFRRRLDRLEEACRPALHFNAISKMVSFSMENPPPSTTFLIRWRLTDRLPPLGKAASIPQGRAKELATRLLAAQRDTSQARLRALGQRLELGIRAALRLPSSDRDALELSVMVYDGKPDARCLRVALGNFEDGDAAWDFRLGYGDGIAGKAFKMNQGRFFVRADAERTRTPYHYYPSTGEPGPGGIRHEVMLSVPLTPPGADDEVYAVLTVGSRRPASALLDVGSRAREAATAGQETVSEELVAISRFCFEEFERFFPPEAEPREGREERP